MINRVTLRCCNIIIRYTTVKKKIACHKLITLLHVEQLTVTAYGYSLALSSRYSLYLGLKFLSLLKRMLVQQHFYHGKDKPSINAQGFIGKRVAMEVANVRDKT